jgi:aspartyl-tRNA(Asn)/glutamyl-tRNA(Gln) amidotransferase subunit A
LDQIGPFTKTVEDNKILFDAIRGYDTMDATSVRTSKDYSLDKNPEELKKLTIGIPEEYFIDGLDPEIKTAVESVIKTYEGMGMKTKRISLPHTKYALSCYYIIMPAELSSNLARLDGIRYGRHPEVSSAQSLKDLYVAARGQGFGPETKRRIILGTYVLSSGYYDAYYGKAQVVRSLVTQDFTNALKEVDVILSPVTPERAFKVGEKTSDPLSMYLSDTFTIPLSLSGLPGISIPVKNIPGLPVGFQLMSKAFHEADILGLGMLYEQEG